MASGEGKVTEAQADHRGEGAREATPSIHDLSACIEEREIDAAGNADDECRIGFADANTDGPQRQYHRATRSQCANECSTNAESAEYFAPSPDRLEQSAGFMFDKRFAFAKPATIFCAHCAHRAKSLAGVTQPNQNRRGCQTHDNVNPEGARCGARDFDRNSGQEWPDE